MCTAFYLCRAKLEYGQSPDELVGVLAGDEEAASRLYTVSILYLLASLAVLPNTWYITTAFRINSALLCPIIPHECIWTLSTT